jgi:hypothetical protein
MRFLDVAKFTNLIVDRDLVYSTLLSLLVEFSCFGVWQSYVYMLVLSAAKTLLIA